jgi:hypothetical protein
MKVGPRLDEILPSASGLMSCGYVPGARRGAMPLATTAVALI